MFAFLIYDREKKRVFAARDRFGIKPLYYSSDKNHLIFASEIKAILAHPRVAAEPDYDSIQDYIIFQYVLNAGTFFNRIQKLLPGHYQVIDLESFDIQTIKYWELDFTVDAQISERDFTSKLEALLEDSVKIQMRSDVPVGTFLSGGIDSSIVTILASRMSSEKIKTFTGAFREGPEFDETKYSREVATACQAKTYEIYPTEDEFIDLLPKLIYHLDEPAAGPGLFLQYMVSRLAAKEVKVVLSGEGGDEIFGGYARYMIAYLEHALKGAVNETNGEGEHNISLPSILPNLPSLRLYIPMLRRFWATGLFEPMDRSYFRLIDRSEGDQSFLSKEFKSSFDPERIILRFKDIFNHPKTLSYYNKMVHYDMESGLPSLLHVSDRVSMAVSLESRVPLLDHRIAELVASIPPRIKFKGAEMKYILKKAARDILPSKIIERKDKMGFPVPLHLWAQNRVRDFCQDTLFSEECRQRGIFNLAQVEKFLDKEEAYSRRLWGVMNLELWFRQFIDENSFSAKT
jgi:asparagine synthase (glutamine-hydrolysing)